MNYSAIINKVEYKVYKKDGTELDLSPCNDLTVDISYAINEYNSHNIDFLKSQSMSEVNIDVFNPNDPYFNDICHLYNKKETDNVLSSRRKSSFQNVTLCESNCIYKNIDFKSRRINCECSIKTHFNVTSLKKEQKNKIHYTNLYLSKCYKIFIDADNWKFNIGFWFSITVFTLELITCIYACSTNFESLYSDLNKYQKSNPPNELYKTNDDKYYFMKRRMSNGQSTLGTSIDELSYYTYSNSDNRFIDSKRILTKEKEITRKYDTQRIIESIFLSKPIDIDDYPYYLSLMSDERTFTIIFWKLLKEKNILLRAIFPKYQYELISSNLCFILFYCDVLFSINAIFYRDSSISKNYLNSNILLIDDIISRPLFSLLLTSILLNRVSLLHYYAKIFNMLVIDVKDNYILGNNLRRILKKVKILIVLWNFFHN